MHVDILNKIKTCILLVMICHEIRFLTVVIERHEVFIYEPIIYSLINGNFAFG